MDRECDPYEGFDEHPDYRAKPKSPRHHAADALASYLCTVGLHGSRTADRDPEGRYYQMTLLPNDVGSGKVRLYGTGYVYVTLFVSLVGIEEKVDRLYGSVEEAATFLEFLLVRRDVEAANGIPQREPSRKSHLETA
jgi:hypothetical protein